MKWTGHGSLLGWVARADGRAGSDGEPNLGSACCELGIEFVPEGTEKGGRWPPFVYTKSEREVELATRHPEQRGTYSAGIELLRVGPSLRSG